jgi:hypothetical protein
MNLWRIHYALNSCNSTEPSIANVVAASAEKAIEGCKVAVWKSNRRHPYAITNVERGIKIDQVQR